MPNYLDFNNDINYTKNINAVGDFKKVTDIERVVDSLVNYLSIPKGHYIGDPNYGSELYKYLFEPKDEITKENIIDEIISATAIVESAANSINFNVYFISGKSIVVDFYVSYNGNKRKISLDVNKTYINRLGS